MTVRLPLFPLGTVLFPHLMLPLHVFEERYRQLVHDLLQLPDDERAFGVVAIRQGREVGADGVRALQPVGCVARVRRVEPHDDGRFDLMTTGTQRFRIVSVLGTRPYTQAEVEPLPEPAGERPADLVPALRALFARYREALGAPDEAAGATVPEEPELLSYFVAATAVLDVTEKQQLLQAATTEERLRAELRLLHRETSLLERLPSLPGVELAREQVSPN